MKPMNAMLCLGVFFAAQSSFAAVLANIGEQKITDEQIRAEYESLPSEQKKAINEDPNTRRTIVENALNAELLVQAAKKAGLDNEPEYKRALERFQRQFLATRFMQKSVEPKLSNSDVKKFFEANKGLFDSTQVCAHHIVVQDEADAEKISGLAKQKGSKFEDLAKKHSLDPSVQENKGNLGCFTREKMVPEFSTVVFNMRKGEVKGPVRTPYGYHVIRVDEIKAGKVPGYDEVEAQVKEHLRTKLVNEMITDLRTKSNASVNDEEAKKFRL